MISRADQLLALMDGARRLWGRPSPGDAEEVGRRLALLRQREEAIADALVVVILGGTKVGKTTLINALAGAEIGQASAKACFTSRPAVFVHATREALARARLAGALRPDDTVVVHAEAALERLILVDTPDLDGVEEAHHAVFRSILERADLALCVLTTQKYDSAPLFRILGEGMGFRRTVMVFNRIDEGIPFSDKIRQDLLRKTAGFGLRPPEGESLPVFALSAWNALQTKTGKTAGPAGQFADLERLLHERLDQALVKRISEENLNAFGAETAAFTAQVSRLPAALALAPELLSWARERSQALAERSLAESRQVMARAVGEIARRREAAAAEHLGGPFGSYVRFKLAVAGLVTRFSWDFGHGGDAAEGLSGQVLTRLQPLWEEDWKQFLRQVAERADRAGLDPAPLLDRLQGGQALAVAFREELAIQFRQQLLMPRASTAEGLLFNLLPGALILLLVWYFVAALAAVREPGAGVFLGGALVFWLICHLQASFWLAAKAGSLDPVGPEAAELLRRECDRRWVAPLQSWCDEVQRVGSQGGDGKTS